MNILIAVHHLPPKYNGGAEHRALRTARALGERGHQVHLVCVEDLTHGPDGGVDWVDERLDGIPVRRLNFDLDKAGDRFEWLYDNPWIGSHLDQLITEVNPDIFHLFGGYLMSASALQAAFRAGKTTLLSLTDYWFVCPRITMVRSDGSLSQFPPDPAACAKCLGEERRRYRWAAQLFPQAMQWYWQNQKDASRRITRRTDFLIQTANRVDRILSPSMFLRDKMIAAGVSADRIVYRRQGLDVHIPSGYDPKGSPPAPLRIAYMGQIASHKGVHLLVEAVRRLPAARLELTIYGDASHFPAYASQLTGMAAGDERIRFAGVYARDQVSTIFSNVDLVVVPSTWYENSPNVILEAFAHKVPVIASNLGAFPELVIPGVSGALFEPNDAGHLAAVLQQFLDNLGRVTELRQSIPAVKSLSQEIDEIEDLYSEALKR
jgi:glycosyltransferase involved in cell wall biosynthesis